MYYQDSYMSRQSFKRRDILISTPVISNPLQLTKIASDYIFDSDLTIWLAIVPSSEDKGISNSLKVMHV